ATRLRGLRRARRARSPDPLRSSTLTANKEANMDRSQSSDSPAVKLARSHLEAWTNQDMETARSNLAEDVQFFSPAANLAGVDEYMEGDRRPLHELKQRVAA